MNELICAVVIIVVLFLIAAIKVRLDYRKGEQYRLGEPPNNDELDEALEDLDPGDPQTKIIKLLAKHMVWKDYKPDTLYSFRVQPERMDEITANIRESVEKKEGKSVATILTEMGVEYETERN